MNIYSIFGLSLCIAYIFNYIFAFILYLLLWKINSLLFKPTFFVQTHFFSVQMLKCLSSLESFECIDNDVNTESIAALAEHLYEIIKIICCFSQTRAHILPFVCTVGCVFVDHLTEKYLSCMSSSVMFCQEGVGSCWDPPNNSQFPELSRPLTPTAAPARNSQEEATAARTNMCDTVKILSCSTTAATRHLPYDLVLWLKFDLWRFAQITMFNANGLQADSCFLLCLQANLNYNRKILVQLSTQ